MKIFKILLPLIFIQGCVPVSTTPFLITIDSINDPKIQSATSYVLLSSKKDVDISDLQFREYSDYVNQVLSKKGWTLGQDISKADMAIFMNYGVGDPQTAYYSYSLPVYGQTGGGNSTFTFNTFGANGSTYTYGKITQPPQFGVVGSQSYSGTVTTFLRYIVLDSVDLVAYRKSMKVIPIWRTTITSRGQSDDMRQIFPYMIGPSINFIGRNTGRQLEIEVDPVDPDVKNLILSSTRNIDSAPAKLDRMKKGDHINLVLFDGTDIDCLYSRSSDEYIYVSPPGEIMGFNEKAYKIDKIQDIKISAENK